MSGSASSDDDWAPVEIENDGVERFKWGLSAETGEVAIWPVSGSGDGSPFHDEHLAQTWGRPPNPGSGDVLGYAEAESASDSDRRTKIHIQAYYANEVPASVLAAFAAAFPEVAIDVWDD
jgi:hypothetical protein